MLTTRIYLSFEDGSFYSSLQKIHLADNLLVFKMINTLKKKVRLWRFEDVQFNSPLWKKFILYLEEPIITMHDANKSTCLF